MDYKTTPTVCNELNISPAALNSWLSRHERYKLRQRDKHGAMLWTDQEIAAIQAARAVQPPAGGRRRRSGV